MPTTPAQHPAHDLPVIHQYHLMVYAFRHHFGDTSSLDRDGGRWAHWWKRLVKADPADSRRRVDDGLETTLDDSYFFLPHVRELMFPETDHLARELLAQGRLPAGLPANAVRRFTLIGEAKEDLSSLALSLPTETAQDKPVLVPFAVDWIDLALFPQNVGFLILKATAVSAGQTLTMGTLRDALRHARILHPLHVGWQSAKWHGAIGSGAAPCDGSRLIDFLLQEVTVTQPGARPFKPRLAEFLAAADGRATNYTETDIGQTYGDAFHLFTYAALGGAPPVPGVVSGPPSPSDFPFDSPTERALYELMSLTNTSLASYVPHPAAVETWRKESCVRLWHNWQAALHQNHATFLGLGDPDWTTGPLSRNIQNDYFSLWLLALFQKIAVSFQFPEVSRRHAKLSDNVKEAREMWRNFLDFESRYWVTEPTRRAQGKILYAGFQKALDVKTVYDELRMEVEDVQKFYESVVQRRNNLLLFFLTVVGLPLGIYVSMFGTSVLWKIPKVVRKGFFQGRWPDFSQGLETEKANALVWLLALGMLSVFSVWLVRRLIHWFDAKA